LCINNKAMILPDWFEIEQLTPINFFRYKSYTTDRLVDFQAHNDRDKERYQIEIALFEELKQKVLGMHYNLVGKIGLKPYPNEILPVRWDNKVVVECTLPDGRHFFFGWKDDCYSIGTERAGDSWVEPTAIFIVGDVATITETMKEEEHRRNLLLSLDVPTDRNGEIKHQEIEACMKEFNVDFGEACEIINQLNYERNTH
jgi:hypothetical protein